MESRDMTQAALNCEGFGSIPATFSFQKGSVGGLFLKSLSETDQFFNTPIASDREGFKIQKAFVAFCVV
jgi:hypothetical protein